MAWTYLFVAGAFEIIWATGLKYTDGFSRVWPSVGTVIAMAISMLCLSLALRVIPIGTAYAIWTGIGAVGVAIVGMVLFHEPRHAVRHFLHFDYRRRNCRAEIYSEFIVSNAMASLGGLHQVVGSQFQSQGQRFFLETWDLEFENCAVSGRLKWNIGIPGECRGIPQVSPWF